MSKEINIKVNARHIGQLGRELVTDYVTALTELVKNSYDADSEAVEVIFENMLSKQGRVIIADTGCGFTSDDIENKWAVIGTNSKVKNPYSEKYKRRCVGRKGIGRYSVERLAEYCTLYSFTKSDLPVKYYTNWNKYEGIDFKELKQRIEILKNNPDFESAKYIKRAVEYLLLSDRIDEESKETIREKLLAGCNLDYTIFYRKNMLNRMEQILYPIYEKYMGLEERVEEIKNVIEELHGVEKDFYYQKLERLYQRIYSGRMDNEPYTGTFLVLDCLRDDWTKKDIEKVIKEFRLLVSPFKEKNEFSIYITASEYELYELELQNNILERRYAKVEANLATRKDENGKSFSVFSATYIDRKGAYKNIEEEFDDNYICGDLEITLYYFLRNQSLKFDELKAGEAKEILDAFCGIKIYRDGFRVRPYGEEGNDWLLLDRSKIRDPHSYRVGNNQVIGVVNINSDDNPLLVDATNREAIIENEAFGQLKQIVHKCINVIENYRYNEYLEEKKRTIIVQEEKERNQERIELQNAINQQKVFLASALQQGNISNAGKVVNHILDTVSMDQKKERKHYERTRQEYEKKLRESNNELQLYRNLAALGILAGSFGHETDDAIARILLNIEYPRERLFRVFPNDDDVEAAFADLDNDIWRISCYSDLLVAFLKKKKRSEAINLSFKKIIEEVVGYYQVLVEEYQVDIDIGDLEEFQCKIAMKQIDLESIIINFLTNAFEALKGVTGARIIRISAVSLEEGYRVAVEDSGKGVPEDLREWIFIPLNTTKKEDGVGLGLTIVKDIVESYGGKIVIGDSAVLGGARFETFFPAAG
ncbi:MAG: GHKL domain-containing protein [Lachnospiraceae bacterium]|nr:GHKL domain-containing protein [Lachnospiraceae bacterium]